MIVKLHKSNAFKTQILKGRNHHMKNKVFKKIKRINKKSLIHRAVSILQILLEILDIFIINF